MFYSLSKFTLQYFRLYLVTPVNTKDSYITTFNKTRIFNSDTSGDKIKNYFTEPVPKIKTSKRFTPTTTEDWKDTTRSQRCRKIN